VLSFKTAPKNITVLFLGRVGDLIVSTPFLRSLRRHFPKARIRLITASPAAEAARLIPFVDSVGVAHRLQRPWANLKLLFQLLTRRCNLLIDLNPSFSRLSATIAVLVSSRVKLAFKKGRMDLAFTHRIAAAGNHEHMLDRYARLAAALGMPYDEALEVRIPAEDASAAQALFSQVPQTAKKDGVSRILIHPGNFKKFDNRWPEEKFVALSNLLLKDPSLRLFFMAGPGEELQVRDIMSRLSVPVPLLPPSTLGITAAMMWEMDLCLLNITGTTHLAAALGIPTFGFYSGYTNDVWRLRGPEHAGIVSSEWESCREIAVHAAYDALMAHITRLRSRPNG